MEEISRFLSGPMRDAKAGADLAKAAIALNPYCASELCNTLGDCLFACGRIVESRQAYFRALRINDSDVRARLNLAWVYNHEKNYRAALSMIAAVVPVECGSPSAPVCTSSWKCWRLMTW